MPNSKRNTDEQSAYSNDLAEMLSTPQWESVREEASKSLDLIHRAMEQEIDTDKFIELRAEAKAVRRIFKLGAVHVHKFKERISQEDAPQVTQAAHPKEIKRMFGEVRRKKSL